MQTLTKLDDGLTMLQMESLEALLTSRTMVEAAEKSGVTTQTLRNWLKSPEFRAAYQEAKREIFDNLSRRLLSLGDKALDGYAEVLREPNMPGAWVLAKVSDSILSQIFKLQEITDFDERLANIETQLVELNQYEYD